MILLGAAVGEGASSLQQQTLSRHARSLLTAAECLLYTGLFGYMAFSYLVHAHLDQLAVPAMAAALLCTASEQSLLHGKLDGSPAVFLGKFSMLLFLNHFCWVRGSGKLLQMIGVTLPGSAVMAAGILLSFAAAAVGWVLGNAMRRLAQRLYRKTFPQTTPSILNNKEN